MKDIVVLTRFPVLKTENIDLTKAKLYAFIVAALSSGAKKVYVAVNSDEYVFPSFVAAFSTTVKIFCVKPWGKIVTALNALLLASRKEIAQGDIPIFASVEVTLTRTIIESLLDHLSDDTAVVGAAMQGHRFIPGYCGQANGRSIPWNTLAAWNPKYLYITGFPPLADGIPDRLDSSGVEEIVTLSIIQSLYPHAKAKLVSVSDINWDTSFFDAARLQRLDNKMSSKILRPAQQLAWAGLKPPLVIHI